MTHKTTQREQIEHLLRVHGSVHTFELRRIFIGNPSQRIAELEARGWDFRHVDEKLNGDAYGTRYVALSEPDVESGAGGEKLSRELIGAGKTSPSPALNTPSDPPGLFPRVKGQFSYATQGEVA